MLSTKKLGACTANYSSHLWITSRHTKLRRTPPSVVVVCVKGELDRQSAGDARGGGGETAN